MTILITTHKNLTNGPFKSKTTQDRATLRLGITH